jgi:hypothetical protein
MKVLSITIRDQSPPGPTRFFRALVSPQWIQRHNNGAVLSCGLEVGRDLSLRSLEGLRRAGRLTAICEEEWKHSGCLSLCIRRGDTGCRW